MAPDPVRRQEVRAAAKASASRSSTSSASGRPRNNVKTEGPGDELALAIAQPELLHLHLQALAADLEQRAAWVTLPPVSSSALTISSRSTRAVSARTISLSEPDELGVLVARSSSSRAATDRGCRRAADRRPAAAAPRHVSWQIGALDAVALAEQDRALEHVLELADVAGPVCASSAASASSEMPVIVLLEPLVELLDDVLDEQRDVAACARAAAGSAAARR